MTVCIATICDTGSSIVAVCDRLISMGWTSADSMMKAERIHARWIAMVASNDLGKAPLILDDVHEYVEWGSATPQQIKDAFNRAYSQARRQHIERTILAPYQITMEEFMIGPSPKLGPQLYGRLATKIEEANLGCQFLVCGFGPQHSDEAKIFAVTSKGEVNDYSAVGFYAIGSGAYAAMGALSFHRYNPVTDLETAVYVACEAKFMAESASDVGERTWVFIMENDGTFVQGGEGTVREIRRLWREQGAPRIPKGAIEVIRRQIRRGNSE